MTSFLLVAAYSYLLGSISFGYLLVRAFHGKDIRETGSGNIGATNVSRTSPVLGVTTLVLDALKGALAVAGTRVLFPARTVLVAAAAFFAIVGHVFPIWLNFRGGKGVATGLGAFLVLLPIIVVVMIGIFVALLVAFRYVSLASILTVAFFPLIAWAFDSHFRTQGTLLFLAASSLLIVSRHHENIRRLWARTEPRFRWRGK